MVNQNLLHRFDHFGIELRQDVVAEFNNRGLNASVLQILRQLHSDEASADDCGAGDLLLVHQGLDGNSVLDISKHVSTL